MSHRHPPASSPERPLTQRQRDVIATVVESLLLRPETRNRIAVGPLRLTLTAHLRRSRSRHRVDLGPLYRHLLDKDLEEVTAANATLDARWRLKRLGVDGQLPREVEARTMEPKRRTTRRPAPRPREVIGTCAEEPTPGASRARLIVAGVVAVVAGAAAAWLTTAAAG